MKSLDPVEDAGRDRAEDGERDRVEEGRRDRVEEEERDRVEEGGREEVDPLPWVGLDGGQDNGVAARLDRLPTLALQRIFEVRRATDSYTTAGVVLVYTLYCICYTWVDFFYNNFHFQIEFLIFHFVLAFSFLTSA